MRNRRVLHVLLGTANGGGELSFCRYLRHGVLDGVSITVAVEGTGSSMLADACGERAVQAYQVGMGCGVIARTIERLRFLRRLSFDVIHVHSYYKGVPWLILAFLAGVPVRVFHSHSSNKEFMRRRFGAFWTGMLYLAMDAVLAAVATRFYYVSDKTRAELPMLARKASCRYHPPYVNPGFGAVPSGNREYDFCFVGRLSRHRIFGDTKGLDTFFAALYQCLAADRTLRIAIFGEGDALEFWREDVRAQGFEDNFHFFSFVEDIETALSSAKVLVAPSRFEGFGLAVLEAQIAGTKVVCSDAFAREVWIADDIVVLSPGASADEWAKACARQLRNVNYRKARVPSACLPHLHSYAYS